jgi:hypothetical protein
VSLALGCGVVRFGIRVSALRGNLFSPVFYPAEHGGSRFHLNADSPPPIRGIRPGRPQSCESQHRRSGVWRIPIMVNAVIANLWIHVFRLCACKPRLLFGRAGSWHVLFPAAGVNIGCDLPATWCKLRERQEIVDPGCMILNYSHELPSSRMDHLLASAYNRRAVLYMHHCLTTARVEFLAPVIQWPLNSGT